MPQTPDKALLSIEGLTFRYRDRPGPAIHDISLTLAPGELVLLAGASGCGKTTLIRCINGLIPRSYKGELTGRISLHGQDPAGLPLARVSQLVGTVLQDPERQILGARVVAEVAFGLENLGLPRPEIRRRVDEALERLGISHLRDRETFLLSGGEKQSSTLIDADAQTVIDILAARRDIETLFEDYQDLPGSDHYQVMSAAAIVRFWTPVSCPAYFPDRQRAGLQAERPGEHIAWGDARRAIQAEHQRNLPVWLKDRFRSGITAGQLGARLAA